MVSAEPLAPSAPAEVELAVRGRFLPALEGLRGVAVGLVVVFHLVHPRLLSGGFLGVDLFFVLSGFLITSLLLEERLAKGGIALLAFWLRRAKRLLPALFVVIATLVLLVDLHAWLSGPRADPRLNPITFRGDALGAIFFASNWVYLHDLQVWNFSSITAHLWSLAVEEQFYLVWPLVTLLLISFGGLRRRWLGAGAAVALAVASSIGTWLVFNHTQNDNAVYLPTPLHASGLLLGAALAWLVAGRPQPGDLARRRLAVASWLGVVVIVGLAAFGGQWHGQHFQQPWMNSWGWPVFVLAATAVVADVRQATPSLLGRLLSWRPLRLLGLISYGLYIIHLCVFFILSPERLGLGRWGSFLVQLVLSLALATLSYRYVELPVRRSTLVDRKPWLVLVAFAVITALVLVGTSSRVTGEAGVVPATSRPVPLSAGGLLPGAGKVTGSLNRPEVGSSYALLLAGSTMAAQLAGPLTLATSASGHRIEQVLSSPANRQPNLADSLNHAAAALRGPGGYLVVATCEQGDLAGASAAARGEAQARDLAAIEELVAGRPSVGLALLGCPKAQAKSYRASQQAFNGLARRAAALHPGAVAFLAVQGGVELIDRYSAYLPPANQPLAQFGVVPWERVRMSDGLHYCQAGAVRVTAATLADLGLLGYDLGPSGTWWRGSWVDSPAFRSPGSCSP